MKVELFDVNEFIDLNKLREVTSPVLFERGGIPNPNGLISNEIFGVNTKSRKETFAYIDLGGNFFHPHIYKIIRRIFRNIDKIINGEKYFSIDQNGALVEDPNGETGIEFIYDNWNKIKWSGNGGMSSERAKLLTKSKKNEIFMNKQIVIPAFYRDINSSESGGGKVPEIDNLYINLIRSTALIKDRDMYDIQFHSTNYNIQRCIVEIYDFFKNTLDKKNGMLRKYLMGKNVDYCTRTVISAPMYLDDDPADRMISFEYTGVSMSQICVLCYPFVVAWVKNFFEREVIENKAIKMDLGGDFVEIKNPEAFYSDSYVKKCIDKFVSEPSSRYDIIPVPTTGTKDGHLVFTGRHEYSNVSADSSGIINRPMTWTDLLYMACDDIVKNKHVMVTRYPILDNFGIFISKIRVLSTRKTAPMTIGDKTYKWYPIIDLDMSHNRIANNFVDTMVFSNSYLKGLDGKILPSLNLSNCGEILVML